MKQLLIVNSSRALGASKTASDVSSYNLSDLAAGAIALFALGDSYLYTDIPSNNFGIALGRPNDQVPFVIPEVDINTLNVTIANPKLGTAVKRKFTFPTPVIGKEYAVRFIKKGTVPHERNSWICSITAGSTTAATEATALKNAIDAKLQDVFTVSVASAVVTITGKTIGDQWEVQLLDGLKDVSFAGSTDFVDAAPSVGDTAYIKNLASQCAAGKGFTDTEQSGQDIIPGYPEAIEEFALNTSGSNGISTTGYAVWTLRFQVGRNAAKTRDEKVWQIVHIAVPKTSSTYSSLINILPAGNLKDNIVESMIASVESDEITG